MRIQPGVQRFPKEKTDKKGSQSDCVAPPQALGQFRKIPCHLRLAHRFTASPLGPDSATSPRRAVTQLPNGQCRSTHVKRHQRAISDRALLGRPVGGLPRARAVHIFVAVNPRRERPADRIVWPRATSHGPILQKLSRRLISAGGESMESVPNSTVWRGSWLISPNVRRIVHHSKFLPPMAEMGHSRHFERARATSAYHPFADISVHRSAAQLPIG